MDKDKLDQLIEDLYCILDKISSGKISEGTGLSAMEEMIRDFKEDNKNNQ